MLDWNAVYKSGKDFGLIPEAIVDQILSFAKKPPATFLDIGCGTGHLSRFLFDKGYTGTGIDLSEEAVKIAALRNNYVTYKKLDIEHDKITELGDSYDVIVCKHTYAFIEDKKDFLIRVHSLLDTRGIFAIITPVRETSSEELRQKKIAVSEDELFNLTKNNFKLKFQRNIKSGTLVIFEKNISS